MMVNQKSQSTDTYEFILLLLLLLFFSKNYRLYDNTIIMYNKYEKKQFSVKTK